MFFFCSKLQANVGANNSVGYIQRPPVGVEEIGSFSFKR